MTSVTRDDVRSVCARIDVAADRRRQKQLVRLKEYYAGTVVWCKQHGICQRCRKEPAETGRVLCWACRMDNNQRRSGAQQAPKE